MSRKEYDTISNVVENSKSKLLSKTNVVSVGVGKKNDTDELCVSVGVSKKVPAGHLPAGEMVPERIGSVKTDVVEIGEIVPELLTAHADRRGINRPVPQGVSVGHPSITAGSTGWMYEIEGAGNYIGSNNHVMAASNDANIGDEIIQPGSADGGSAPADAIGSLAYYVPIENGVDVDLALAKTGAEIDNRLVGIDKPVVGVTTDLSVGDELVKSGRTTGVQRAEIQQLDASVNVNYGGSLGTVTINGCIMTGSMSDGGDSGSSTAKETDGGLEAAGRVFAGSSSVSVHHNIENELRHITDEFGSDIQLITDGGSQMPTANVTLTLSQEEPEVGNIEAAVEDESGDPVSSATVSIEGPTTKSLQTGSGGTVTFTEVTIGDYTVSADKDGYGTASTTVEAGQFE